MKIATWNVAYGRGHATNLRRKKAIDVASADTWILTETHDDLLPGRIGEHTPIHSLQRTSQAQGVVTGSRWVSIWSRLPVIHVETRLHDPHRTSACTVIGEFGSLLVFGAVLPWYGDDENRKLPDQS